VPAKAGEKACGSVGGRVHCQLGVGTSEVQVVQWRKVDEKQVGSLVSVYFFDFCVKPTGQANAIKCDQVVFFSKRMRASC
jgi:hypothetical protein